MAAEHRPQQSQRDELSVVTGEDLATWVERVRVKAIVDPQLVAEERDRQDGLRSQFARRSRQRVRVAAGWLIASLVALAGFVALDVAAGLTVWLVVASVIAVVAGVAATTRARQRQRSGATAAITPGPLLRVDRVVRLTELDGSCRMLAERARQAVAGILSSPDFPGSLLDDPATKAALREEEWQVAVLLRGVTQLRAQYDADPPTKADGTARRLDAEQNKLTARVRKLEELAENFKNSSIARRRYERKDRVGRLKAQERHLAAMIDATTENATGEINAIIAALAELQEGFEDKTGEEDGG